MEDLIIAVVINYTYGGKKSILINYSMYEPKEGKKLDDNEICKSICQNNDKFISEKNTCIDDCSKDDIYKYEFNNSCYNNCPNNTISSQDKIFFCEMQCSYDFPYQIIETGVCVKNCSSNYLFKKVCKLLYKNKNKEDSLIKNVDNDIVYNLIDPFIYQNIEINKIDAIFKDADNNIYQLSTIDNQNNNKAHNISTIKLGSCENKLRENYNIPNNKINIKFFLV